MRQIAFFSLLVLLLSSCERSDFFGTKEYTINLPGNRISDMALDHSSYLWLVTSETDTSIDLSEHSGDFPMRNYLIRLNFDSYKVSDDRFPDAQKIMFDKYDRLWFMTSRGIFCSTDQKYTKLYSLEDTAGQFEWMISDLDDNIWAGGLCPYLLKITPDFKITVYDASVTPLPTLNIRAGHIDKKNNLWLALWSEKGLAMRDTGGNWSFFNSANSSITSQNIWCITSDKNNNIWIGTDWSESFGNLMKYDGKKWLQVLVVNEDETINKGSIRQLHSDARNIWVVSDKIVDQELEKSLLQTYDGFSWKKVSKIPENDRIVDIELDLYYGRAYVATLNNGCYQVRIR